jgi:hypothetical protein
VLFLYIRDIKFNIVLNTTNAFKPSLQRFINRLTARETVKRKLDSLYIPSRYITGIILIFTGTGTYLDDKNSSQNFPVTVPAFRT